MKNIMVDIDGTLTIETEGWDYEKRTPEPQMIKIVNEMYDSGYSIILWTSRFSVDKKVTKTWLKKYGVKYHNIIFDKPQFDFMIDDKCAPPMLMRIQPTMEHIYKALGKPPVTRKTEQTTDETVKLEDNPEFD